METPLNGQALPAIQTVWVMVAAILVMFMQVGFLFLEIGFSRMKNAGTIVPKILANFSIAALCYWAVGFALAFGGTGWFAGTAGTFLGTNNGDLFPAMAFSRRRCRPSSSSSSSSARCRSRSSGARRSSGSSSAPT